MTRFGLVDVICDCYGIHVNPCLLFVSLGEEAHLIHVSHGPALCNGKLDRDVLALQIPHAPRRIVPRPLVVQPMVERRLVGLVAVAAPRHALDGVGPVPTQVAQMPGLEGVRPLSETRVELSEMTVSSSCRYMCVEILTGTRRAGHQD